MTGGLADAQTLYSDLSGPWLLDILLYLSKNKVMKIKVWYGFLVLGLPLVLSSCAPVLDRSIMSEGERRVSFQELREHPDQYKGLLYIFGGVIVQTKFTEAGAQVEALHVPVDRYGYFEDRGRSEGRFLAVLPRDRQALDPVVYRRGRRITLAAVFTGARSGKIDEMEYVYPVFEIRQIYLWPRERLYYYPPPFYYYDPWFYPYPYYYRYPWWGDYYRGQPAPVQPVPGQSPGYRRPPPPNEPSAPAPQQRNEPEREHR